MKQFLLLISSVLFWTWFLISSVVLTPPLIIVWALTVPFDRRRSVLHKLSCFWGAQYFWANPLWRSQITGKEKFDDRYPWIVISNHQSLVDIMVIYGLFKRFRWTSKAENFKVPFVGWVLSFNRSIRVYRASRDAYRRFRNQAVAVLEMGTPIMIFPEGTRSGDGQLGRFKQGAFMLAHETHTGIIPMVLDGSYKAIRKKGWRLTGFARIQLKILDPVPYDEFKDLSTAETTAKFRKIIDDELQALRS
ncbi:MAG TPA: lysophospholipid acyltransferase family protein [Bacteroidales bacterium]|nr:lysophospholipid acyltransferase family protein [Bacteroidales bacterium]